MHRTRGLDNPERSLERFGFLKGRERNSLAFGDEELSDHGGFVDDCRGIIADAKGRMQGKELKRKFVRDERRLHRGEGQGGTGRRMTVVVEGRNNKWRR